jgi:hypothetical protein
MSLKELPAALISSFKLAREFFDLSDHLIDEWIFVGSSQAAMTLGAFSLCVSEERLLAKSVKIVEVKKFFHSFDRTFFSSNKNHLIILVRTEDQVASLIDCVLIFLLEKKACYVLFNTGALAMEGVNPDVHYLLTLYVAEACLKAIVDPVAEKRGLELN